MPSRLATIMIAQAQHETGNFTHRFFTVGNNAFGYSYVPGAKWQLPTPGSVADNGAKIAQYASVQNSVHELTDWIKRRQREGKFPPDLSVINTGDEYAALLKGAGYYGASEETYAAGIKRWLTQAGAYVADSSPWLVVLLLSALAYRYRKKLFR